MTYNKFFSKIVNVKGGSDYLIGACKSSCKHILERNDINMKVIINLSEKGLKANIYFCACWIIGGYENALSDYGAESEEGKEAKEWLEDRQQMIEDILYDGTHFIYMEGFEGFPSDNLLSDAYRKYPSNIIIGWVEEAIDLVISE